MLRRVLPVLDDRESWQLGVLLKVVLHMIRLNLYYCFVVVFKNLWLLKKFSMA